MSFTTSIEQLVASSDSPLLGKASEWSRVPLGSVARVVNGFPFRSDFFVDKGGVPVIRIRDVTAGYAGTFYDGPVPDGFWVEPGDLVIGMDGDFNSRIWSSGRALLNQRVCKVIVDENKADKNFIAYVLPGYLRAINDATHSVTVKHLSSKTISQIPLPFPPVRQQRRIVARLDRLFNSSRNANEEIARIPKLGQRYKQGILSAAFQGNLTADWRKTNTPSQKWPVKPLGDLAIDVRYGTSAKCHYEPIATPVLRIPNVVGLRIDTNDLKYGRFNKAEIEKLSLRSGDLLVIRSNGSLNLVGRTALATEEVAGYLFAGYLIRLRLDPTRINPAFAQLALEESSTRSTIEKLAKSTSGVNNINSEQLKQLKLPVPSLEEQDEILRRISVSFAQIDQVLAEAARAHLLLGRINDSMIAKMLRGELVPSDPNEQLDLASILDISNGALNPVLKQKKANAKLAPRAPREKATMTKSRYDDDVKDKPYLAGLLKEVGQPVSVEKLFKQAELPLADFYKQLAWEVDAGHIRNDDKRLEAA